MGCKTNQKKLTLKHQEDQVSHSIVSLTDKLNACIEIVNALKRTRAKVIEVLDIVKITQLSIQISKYEGKASVYEELLNNKQ